MLNIKDSVLSVFILISFAVLWRPTPIQLKTRRSSDLSNFPFSPSLKSVNTGRSHSFEFVYIQFLHGRMGGWMKGFIDKKKEGRKYRRMKGCKNGRMEG